MEDKVDMQRGVAQFLLDEKFLLTAFEFLHELQEGGWMEGAEDLAAFFADQSRFSPQCLQSSREQGDGGHNGNINEKARPDGSFTHTGAQGMDDGAATIIARSKEQEEVVSRLKKRAEDAEKELQAVTQEVEKRTQDSEKQLQAVAQELQRERQRNRVVHQQSLHSRSFSENSRMASSDAQQSRVSSDYYLEKHSCLGPLEAPEREEINWAVREYLAESGYKLTAITFCDEEAEQDWEYPPPEQPCKAVLNAESCPAGSLLRRLYFQALHLDALNSVTQKKFEAELAQSAEKMASLEAEVLQMKAVHRNEQEGLQAELDDCQKDLEAARAQGHGLQQQVEKLKAQMSAGQQVRLELEDRVKALEDSEIGLKQCLEMEAELASSRKLRVVELEAELLLQKQAAEVAAAELAQRKVAETRKLSASISADRAVEGGSSRLAANLTPPRSPKASRLTPPGSPRSSHGEAPGDVAKRQLVEMTTQVSELKELLEEEKARSSMLAARAEAASRSARSSPVLSSLAASELGKGVGNGPASQSQSRWSAEDGGHLPGFVTNGPHSAGDSEVHGEALVLGSVEGDEEEQVPRERMSSGERRAVRLITDSLPKIAPNVLINHRQELLPLLLYAIERHPDKEVRSGLVHSLFNLIKKPDEEQRVAIVAACVDLLGRLGGEAFEEEVLARGWDELGHKNEEKRLLVSQLCVGIAPHVAKRMKEGVLLSLMLAVAEDPAGMVREAAALHLAQMLPALDDISLHPQIEKVVFQLVCDSDGVVVDEALQTLVPAFVTWSIGRKHPFGQVLRAVLQRMRAELEKCPPLIAATAANSKRPEAHMRNLGEREKWNFGVLLRMLTGLLAEVRHVAYRTCPESLKSRGVEEDRGGGEEGSAEGSQEKTPEEKRPGTASPGTDEEARFITEGLLRSYAKASFEWPAFDWMAVDCLPTLISLSLMVPPKDDDLRFRMCSFLLEVSNVFGRPYLMAVELPMFLTAVGHSIDTSTLHPKTAQKIALLKPEGPPGERAAKMCTLPLLLGGLLGSPLMREGHLKRYLREWVLASCAKVGAWSPASTPELIDGVRFLCNKFGDHRDTMCGVLWDLVVNTTPAVRATAAVLFGTLAESSDAKKVNQQILPALVTLGADQVAEVKIATIGAFGRILKQFKDESVVGKVREQMDLFLEDGSHETSVAVLKALVPTVPVTTNSMREYLLQKVHAMATNPHAAAANISTRLDKTDAMCLAIRALEHTEMASSAMSNLFLPAVQALLKDSDALEPGNKEALEAILKDRWAGQLGTFGKAMGKTLGILTSPNPPRPTTAPSAAPVAGTTGFSSFAAAFTSAGGGTEGAASAWGLDSLTSSFEERYGNKGVRTKLFK